MKRQSNQPGLITTVFQSAKRVSLNLTQLVPDIDRGRCEYALASVLLEESLTAR